MFPSGSRRHTARAKLCFMHFIKISFISFGMLHCSPSAARRIQRYRFYGHYGTEWGKTKLKSAAELFNHSSHHLLTFYAATVNHTRVRGGEREIDGEIFEE